MSVENAEVAVEQMCTESTGNSLTISLLPIPSRFLRFLQTDRIGTDFAENCDIPKGILESLKS